MEDGIVPFIRLLLNTKMISLDSDPTELGKDPLMALLVRSIVTIAPLPQVTPPQERHFWDVVAQVHPARLLVATLVDAMKSHKNAFSIAS
jgi:hypothetical protein